jgi:hypothetical protein
MADGFMLETGIDEAPRVVAELNRHRRELGRGSEPFGLAARIELRPGKEGAAVDAAEAWRGLGITHLSVDTMDTGIRTPLGHLEATRAFMDAMRSNAGS